MFICYYQGPYKSYIIHYNISSGLNNSPRYRGYPLN